MSATHSEGLERITFSKIRIAELLDSTRWANEFSWEDIVQLAAYFDAYKARKGAVIVKEGHGDQRMAIIVSGHIDIVKRLSNLKTKPLAKLRTGQTLGEMSMIDNEPRSATAIAATEVELLIMSRASFIKLGDEKPKLALALTLKLARMLSQRLRSTSGQLVEYKARS